MLRFPPAAIWRRFSALRFEAMMLVFPPEARTISPPLSELKPEFVVVLVVVLVVGSGVKKTRTAFLARTLIGASEAMRRKGWRESSWSEANKSDEAF